MHAIQVKIWRFYFEGATASQQRLIVALMNFNPRPVQWVVLIALVAFAVYHLAVLLVLMGWAE